MRDIVINPEAVKAVKETLIPTIESTPIPENSNDIDQLTVYCLGQAKLHKHYYKRSIERQWCLGRGLFLQRALFEVLNQGKKPKDKTRLSFRKYLDEFSEIVGFSVPYLHDIIAVAESFKDAQAAAEYSITEAIGFARPNRSKRSVLAFLPDSYFEAQKALDAKDLTDANAEQARLEAEAQARLKAEEERANPLPGNPIAGTIAPATATDPDDDSDTHADDADDEPGDTPETPPADNEAMTAGHIMQIVESIHALAMDFSRINSAVVARVDKTKIKESVAELRRIAAHIEALA
jgi:hypothetical protein